jgi:hypothetical protein
MTPKERQSLLALLATHLRTTDSEDDAELASRIEAGTLTDDDYDTLQGICEMALEDHKLSREA